MFLARGKSGGGMRCKKSLSHLRTHPRELENLILDSVEFQIRPHGVKRIRNDVIEERSEFMIPNGDAFEQTIVIVKTPQYWRHPTG